MGYMRHHAIVVTAWSEKNISACHAKATEVFGSEAVSAVGPEVTNGYRSFFVGVDGSKEWWPESDADDKRRAAFVEWLSNPPDGVYCDWAEVQYGDEEHDNRVLAASGGVGRTPGTGGEARGPIETGDREP